MLHSHDSPMLLPAVPTGRDSRRIAMHRNQSRDAGRGARHRLNCVRDDRISLYLFVDFLPGYTLEKNSAAYRAFFT
jgi:hypothetical protein